MITGGVAVVLPCRNEARSIGPMLRDLQAASQELGEAITAVFVDDGSSDGTWQAIVAAVGNTDGVVVTGIRLEAPLGKGTAQAVGLRASLGADVVILMDSDGQHPADRIPTLVEAVRASSCAAIGTRVGYRRSVTSAVGTRALGGLMRVVGTRFDPDLSEFVAMTGPEAASLSRSPRLGVAPLVPLVQSVSPEYTAIDVPIGSRYSGEVESRWTFSSLWQKALLQLLADPWRLLPRLTLLAVFAFLTLAVVGVGSAIYSISQGTTPGTVAIIVAVILSAAITVGLAIALMVISVMTLQSVAGLHDQAGIREVIGDSPER